MHHLPGENQVVALCGVLVEVHRAVDVEQGVVDVGRIGEQRASIVQKQRGDVGEPVQRQPALQRGQQLPGGRADTRADFQHTQIQSALRSARAPPARRAR
ncbi:hypothetical protein NDY24_21140 [Xanthomonas hortorum pv. pelargonii]|nr:hypothetical protein NDY24_21140 [Xanthomonas hortorum pv. pelargonii]